MTINPDYVCDTNVLISSLISKKSPPAQAVSQIRSKGFFAFSGETFAELEAVLSRPKFDRFIKKEDRTQFIQQIKAIRNLYEIQHTVELCRDPKDNKFLDVAIASHADCLITGDDDLLVLDSIQGTPIVTPRAFISA